MDNTPIQDAKHSKALEYIAEFYDENGKLPEYKEVQRVLRDEFGTGLRTTTVGNLMREFQDNFHRDLEEENERLRARVAALEADHKSPPTQGLVVPISLPEGLQADHISVEVEGALTLEDFKALGRKVSIHFNGGCVPTIPGLGLKWLPSEG